MNDLEILEGLRDRLRYAEQGLVDASEIMEAANQTLVEAQLKRERALNAYCAHLEMLAATMTHSQYAERLGKIGRA